MNRITTASAVVIGALGTFGAERAASACGGCFHPPTQSVSDITDERMLLSVSTTQTTLYDQIQYSGSPSSFAWVLPIHGTVTVGLSADVLFDSVDVVTQTTIVPPTPNCPSPNCRSTTAPTAGNSFGAGASDQGTVTVTKQQNVGPYATVQLHSTDASALDNWLAQNGFVIPDDVVPVMNEYVTEGFDFLAMKLQPDQGVQSMRPVRVSAPGASLSLPLRMAAVGTGSSVGISIWVVADGRYEPQNFPFFRIADSELVWDFGANLSNYTTLRVQHEAALQNKGWEIESSIDVNEQLLTSVILSGGQYYNGGGAFTGSPGAVSDPSQDYLPVGDPDAGAGDSGEPLQTAEEVRTADVAALFAGMTGPSVRVTRIRSDISHAAMTADLVLQASLDQSTLSNVRNVTNSVNLTCPIYNGCTQVGTGTPEQAAASVKGSGGGGCAAAPEPNSRGGFAWALGAVVGLAAFGGGRNLVSRRRRDRSNRG
jgi:hypothetical protein